MELEVNKINRQVYFVYAPIYDSELDPIGKNNRWVYDRAPDGYKFILRSVDVSSYFSSSGGKGIFSMYDGHEFTNWLIFPGVESKELLCRGEVNLYTINIGFNLNDWECKEFTIGVRSRVNDDYCKFCVIVWYYLRKMTSDETKMYAVLQPKSEHYRKGGPRTLTRGEETVD